MVFGKGININTLITFTIKINHHEYVKTRQYKKH